VALLPSDLEFPPAVTDIHVPHRPQWWCRACREDWPCATARPALRDQLAEHRTQTRLYLYAQLEAALADLGDDGRELWHRIVALREPAPTPDR
jgi:hypothetical protein